MKERSRDPDTHGVTCKLEGAKNLAFRYSNFGLTSGDSLIPCTFDNIFSLLKFVVGRQQKQRVGYSYKVLQTPIKRVLVPSWLVNVKVLADHQTGGHLVFHSGIAESSLAGIEGESGIEGNSVSYPAHFRPPF